MLKGCSQVSLDLSFVQAKQPQLSQSVLKGGTFHLLDHFCGPLLDALQKVCISPVLRTPQGEASPAQSRGSSLRCPAGHTAWDAALDAAQDIAGFLGCESTLLPHV